MSSDRQRLVGAIRRIANIDAEDGERASASANRGSQPGSVGRGITESNNRLCCDGSESSSTNPGTATRDPGAGGQDGGLNLDDPADLGDMAGGCLSGVTDCGTDEPVCFCGEGFIPPDGWDEPGAPPPEEFSFYEEGAYWKCGIHTSNSAVAAATMCKTITHTSVSCSKLNDSIVRCIFENQTQQQTVDVAKDSCTLNHAPACDEPPPLEDAWPSDGCINLSIAGGKIVGSKFDPENDGSYNAPRGEIELCDGSNGSILIRPSASGGWKSIASLSGDIDPDTDHGYLYSAYGDTIRQISPSEFRDDRV